MFGRETQPNSKTVLIFIFIKFKNPNQKNTLAKIERNFYVKYLLILSSNLICEMF
jgi:hypothetical protein